LQLMAAADALIARHLDGVTVRLVSDSHYRDREAMQRCIRAGIPVVFDERSAFMHDKFCVVDGRAVWTGSTNITENCMYRNNNNALLIVSAELAEDYTAEFLEMFEKKRFGGRSPQNTPHPLVMVSGISVECYFAPEDHVQREIVAEIRESVQSIDFMAFSFTSKEIAVAMAARMKDGVRVRGVFEGRNVNNEASRDDYLRERGAEIHLDTNSYTMHHKVIIIDVATVITGSYNFSKNAEEDNDENLLIIHDPETAKTYAGEFARLIQ
jgi:phosphatidylserine/phosphatidylglycerophosphate/cardiolipin synthase-like enzyme